jgi:hypothetical protein
MIKLSKPSPLEEKAFSYDNRKERNEEANKSPLGSYKREASRDEKRRVSTPQIGVSKELENKFSGLGGQPLSTKAKKVELAVSKELKAKSRVELQGYPASLKDSPIKSTKKGYASQEKAQNIVPLNKRRESGANAGQRFAEAEQYGVAGRLLLRQLNEADMANMEKNLGRKSSPDVGNIKCRRRFKGSGGRHSQKEVSQEGLSGRQARLLYWRSGRFLQ